MRVAVSMTWFRTRNHGDVEGGFIPSDRHHYPRHEEKFKMGRWSIDEVDGELYICHAHTKQELRDSRFDLERYATEIICLACQEEPPSKLLNIYRMTSFLNKPPIYYKYTSDVDGSPVVSKYKRLNLPDDD